MSKVNNTIMANGMTRANRSFLIGGSVLLLLIVGFFLLAEYLLQIPFDDFRESQEIKAERRLFQEKSAYLETWQRAKLLEQRLKQQQATEQHWLFTATATFGRATLNLWFVWVIALIGTAIFLNRHRLQMQVDFEFAGLKTMLPQPTAERLAAQAIAALAQEAEVKALAFREDLAHQRLKDDVSTIRTLKGLVSKEPSALVDITPDSLPAFTGEVFLSQLLLDNDYEPGLIPYGRALDTGALVQVDWITRKSCIKLGDLGTGKTMSAKAEVWAAFHGKFELGAPLRLHLIDKHYGFRQSLATDLKPYLPLFDSCVLGKEATTGKTLAFLHHMIDEAEAFQASDRDDPEWLDLIWFDEYNETVEEAEDGAAIEKAVKRLMNLRKADKYFSLNVYDGSKGSKSHKGLNPAKMACSQMIYRTNESQAGNLLGWAEKSIIQQVPKLKKGQCVVLLPDLDNAADEPTLTLCQTALVTDADFYRFAQFLPTHNRNANAGGDATGSEDAEPESDEAEPKLTPDFVKAWIEERKAADPKYSQNKLAEEIGFSKKDLSLWMNEKQSEPKISELETALHLLIFGTKDQSVVNLKQWQKYRQERSGNG